MGLAMSLAQNETAMRKYALLDEVEKQRLNDLASCARSSSEMKKIVSDLALRSDIV